MAADFDSPLLEFLERTKQIKLIVVALEAAAATPNVLAPARAGVELNAIGGQTGNAVNAMSLVFLASSFEEFVREEVGQAAALISENYGFFEETQKNPIRLAYWTLCMERLKTSNGIFIKGSSPTPDAHLIEKMRDVFDSAMGFGLDGNAAYLDRKIMTSHKNNMRPDVINDLGRRVGIKDLIGDAADNPKIKARFNVTKKQDSAERLRPKLEEFYLLRNSIVHSLNDAAGQGVDVVLEYLEFFEEVADSMKNVLVRATNKWPVQPAIVPA